MLIVKEVSEKTEGTWFKFKLRGHDVELKIRPFSSEVYTKIRERNTIVHSKNEVTNEDKVTEEFLDYLLQDFKGFCDEERKVLEVNVVNKRRIANIPPLNDNETSISDFIFFQSKKLTTASEEEIQKLEKK